MTRLSQADWKKRLFGGDAGLRAEARIRKQVDGIERFLDIKFRARILDLGCGSGSQTIELARRHYRILGMEHSPAALTRAREAARREKLTVHFMATDMRKIPYQGEFSAVINVRNPIGCYPTEAEDLRCLKSVNASLRPGGKLLLDLLNREWLIRRLDPHDRSDREAFSLETGRLDCRGFSARGERLPSMAESMRLYSLAEISRMLDEAGFQFRRVWGGYDGRPYELESPRMILLAEKKPEKPARRKRLDDLPRAIRIKGRPK